MGIFYFTTPLREEISLCMLLHYFRIVLSWKYNQVEIIQSDGESTDSLIHPATVEDDFFKKVPLSAPTGRDKGRFLYLFFPERRFFYF